MHVLQKYDIIKRISSVDLWVVTTEPLILNSDIIVFDNKDFELG